MIHIIRFRVPANVLQTGMTQTIGKIVGDVFQLPGVETNFNAMTFRHIIVATFKLSIAAGTNFIHLHYFTDNSTVCGRNAENRLALHSNAPNRMAV